MSILSFHEEASENLEARANEGHREGEGDNEYFHWFHSSSNDKTKSPEWTLDVELRFTRHTPRETVDAGT